MKWCINSFLDSVLHQALVSLRNSRAFGLICDFWTGSQARRKTGWLSQTRAWLTVARWLLSSCTHTHKHHNSQNSSRKHTFVWNTNYLQWSLLKLCSYKLIKSEVWIAKSVCVLYRGTPDPFVADLLNSPFWLQAANHCGYMSADVVSLCVSS